MIAACPKCGARYRVDDGRLPPQGARLRCSRCEAVFKVAAPQATEPPPPAPEAAPAPVPQAPARRPEAQGAAQPGAGARRGDGGPLVLVADPEVEAGRATAATLGAWGLETLLVHDGVEAILNIQRSMPQAVVLDAALPKMFGFQVCELMKRNESLRHIHVVLVGAIHDRERYRRPPSELYGADAYIERPQLPDALRSILRDFGLSLAAAPSPPAPAPEPQASAVRPPAHEPSTRPQASGEVAKAERLARIVVSDIVLYNPEKFQAALASGNVVEAMADELEEGRALFRQRVDPALHESRDFLAQELLRVAKQRGMK